MKNTKKNTTKIHKLTDIAKKIDKQLMDLLKGELENLRNMSKTGAAGKVNVAS